MHRQCYLVGFSTLLLASVALAQDPETDAILTSQAPSRAQIATLKSVIRQRVDRLVSAGENSDTIKRAHDSLVDPTKVKGATPAGLASYASIAAEELEEAVTGDDFNVALEAMLILMDIDHPQTAPTLAVALSSKQSAVRLIAARSITKLHPRLKDDAENCPKLLRALGKAGAEEQDQHVLRAIYLAIDFGSTIRDFKYSDEAASALSQVFEARLRRLIAGSRDETRDEAGLRAAAGCYAGAGAPNKTRLMTNLQSLLQVMVQRYLEGDVAPEYLKTLARLIARTEGTIHQIMGSKAPGKKLASILKGAAPTKKMRDDANAALADLAKALQGEPWNIQ